MSHMSYQHEQRAFGSQFLEDILTWVRDEYLPDELYDEKDMADWVMENADHYADALEAAGWQKAEAA